MQLQINGEAQQLEGVSTLAELVEKQGLAGRRIAIELNGEIIPRAEHASTALTERDEIEIVHAIGGG